MNAEDYSRIAACLYREAPYPFRLIQQLRPLICPYRALNAAIPSASSILDVGCGGGLFIGILAYAGKVKSAIGIDSNPKAIRVAQGMKERLPNSSQIAFEIVEAGDSWSPDVFDVVSMIDVMHHIPKDSQAAFFAKAVGRVAPGGILLYKDIAARPYWRATANRLHDLVLARQWIEYAPIELVKQWASTLGLIVECSRTIDMLWYRHELLVLRTARSRNAVGGPQ